MKTLVTKDLMGGILFDVQQERERQEDLKRAGKFRFTCADLQLTNAEKLSVLAEEFGEAAKEVTELIIDQTSGSKLIDQTDVAFVKQTKEKLLKQKLRKELIQVAAVCVAWCESLDQELDTREEFSAEQASMSTNLADLKVCGKRFGTLWTTDHKEIARICELPSGHTGSCGLTP